MSASYDVHFRVDIDAELCFDIVADGVAEVDNLLTCGTTAIDEDEGLLVVNACTAQRAAFPATLVNHPAGRNLLVVSIYIIMWHIGIGGQQLLKLLTLYHGIHEEAARIARDLGVRELGIADVDDYLTELGGCGCLDASAIQLATDIAILGRLAALVAGQAVDDMGDEVFVLPLVLETAVAVAILALLASEDAQATGTYLDGLDSLYQVLDLGTIGTDILDGTGTHLTRNERQVFSTKELMTNAPGNELVPRFTTTTANMAIRLGFNAF